MTRGLRRVHLLTFVAVALALAVGLPLSLSSRAPTVQLDGGEPSVETSRQEETFELSLPPDLPIPIEVIRRAGDYRLRLGHGDASSAALLVYWTPPTQATESLPPSARLMSARSRSGWLRFPPEAATQPGVLWFWSLAHRQLEGRVGLPALETLAGEAR